MGLIAAALNAAGGTLASQWKEYFYVDALPDNVLATKAEKKVKGRFGGIVRSVELLPAPLEPISVTICPSCTSNEMPLTASMPP